MGCFSAGRWLTNKDDKSKGPYFGLSSNDSKVVANSFTNVSNAFTPPCPCSFRWNYCSFTENYCLSSVAGRIKTSQWQLLFTKYKATNFGEATLHTDKNREKGHIIGNIYHWRQKGMPSDAWFPFISCIFFVYFFFHHFYRTSVPIRFRI
jgi:hypothetical protein